LKCYVHPDAEAVTRCYKCGNDICEKCKVDYYGKDICVKCGKPLMALFGCMMQKHNADQYIECKEKPGEDKF
jgi:hypothetical protein